MQKRDGMFKLSFSEEQSDYCTDSKRHKIITVRKKKRRQRTGYDTIYSFLIAENRKKNTYCSCLHFGKDLVQPWGTAEAKPEITETSKGGEKLKDSKAVKRTAAKPQREQRKALTLF